MKSKKLLGLIVLIVGVGLIFYAVHSMNRIKAAKGDVSTVSKFLPHNTLGNYANKELHRKASEYDTPVRIMLIGGIVLAVVGGGIVVFSKKKKH